MAYEFDIRIEDIVAFVEFNVEIPLEKITGRDVSVPGIIYKIKEPNAAVLISRNGKISCTGVKNMGDAMTVLRKAVDKVGNSGISLGGDIEMKVKSITAVARLSREFKLEEISYALDKCEYDPKKIHGLIYKITNPQVTMVLYRSGKVLCTHAKSIEDIQKGLSKLESDLKSVGFPVMPMMV
ncbi:MAG: hypothetical protein KKC05_03810 [Nanoarchaeota archaeon]|nr:hypothetical protein [Nanoarchaeota archaeon]